MVFTSGSVFLGESQSIFKPPYFNGANYFYWKTRIMLFIQANDLTVWDIIMDGPLYTSQARKSRMKKIKEPKRIGRVSSSFNANKIWDKLEVRHEGTSQVNKSKVDILTLNYETFKMKPKEDIKTMSNRFTIIINRLKSYGKTYPNEEVLRKMLRSLFKSLEANVITIEEAKNLETLTLNELIGSLLTHEVRLNEKVEEAKIEKKNVGVAIKSTTNEYSESSEEVDEVKEMIMFARRFKKFMSEPTLRELEDSREDYSVEALILDESKRYHN
ncbi:hypothetical protein EPI10_005003 [Gossypium australe]|uniref:UBN2 domain-containing protein n=1 Tax=Gossypium australe TaxID=47621 RepID=A0A5B6WNG2_9ROSI|nr:hypothetical protein EPI10_005003 [Gossypium australe]